MASRKRASAGKGKKQSSKKDKVTPPQGDSLPPAGPQLQSGENQVLVDASAAIPDNTFRLLLTGIATAVQNGESLVIVAVDGPPRRSNVNGDVIPLHRAWLLVRSSDLSEYSREPDFEIEISAERKYGIFLLDRERLELDTGGRPIHSSGPVAHDPSVIDMSKVCTHTKLRKAAVAVPPSTNVAAQLKLPLVSITPAAITPESFSFIPPCPVVGDLPAKQVAHIGQVDIGVGAGPLGLRSRPFDAQRPSNRDIVFKGGQTFALFANTPVPDISKFVRGIDDGTHQHSGPDIHFELFYDLIAESVDHKPVPFFAANDGRNGAAPGSATPVLPHAHGSWANLSSSVPAPPTEGSGGAIAPAIGALPRIGNCPMMIAVLGDGL